MATAESVVPSTLILFALILLTTNVPEAVILIASTILLPARDKLSPLGSSSIRLFVDASKTSGNLFAIL